MTHATIPVGSVLLLTASLPAERNAPELTGVIGSTKDILSIMFQCRRYDAHVQAWRWSWELIAADQRSAAVAALANEICAKARQRT